ncbi:MAG: hypothetical protein AB1540_10875 [Bdellovibrionota bacterium]
MKNLILIALIALLSVGCSNDDDAMAEKARLEGREAAKTQVDAENENLAKRAKAMEDDLSSRQRFYQAVSGIYEGKMRDARNAEWNVRLTLVSTLPVYQPNRTRTPAEIEADINNLYLNVQTLQWNRSQSSASGCAFEKIRPDLKTGRIELVAPNCPNSYSIDLSEESHMESNMEMAQALQISSNLTASLLSGQKGSIGALAGYRHSARRSSTYSFFATRATGGRLVPENPGSAVDEDVAIRVQEMEADLAKRHAFYSAAAGTYEGSFKISSTDYKIRLTFVPSLPPYTANRIRTIEEVTSDLTNLYFNVQVVQWNPKNNLSSVGCRIQSVRPDLVNGKINIASESCPNFFALELFDGRNPQIKSQTIAAEIRKGDAKEAQGVRGEIRPTTNASIFSFTATRTGN